MKTIIVGHQAVEAARRVLERATRIAGQEDAALRIVHRQRPDRMADCEIRVRSARDGASPAWMGGREQGKRGSALPAPVSIGSTGPRITMCSISGCASRG